MTVRPAPAFAPAFAAAALPKPVFAGDFGVIRVPDRMDVDLLSLVPATVALRLLTDLCTPSQVPFNQLHRVHRRLPFVSRWIDPLRASRVIAIMAALFSGMGLERASEAGG